MRRTVSLILCICMLAMFIMPANASDNIDVCYALDVTASRPLTGEMYAVGETVTVTVTVSTKDAQGVDAAQTVPPIYAFNGSLGYDPYFLQYMTCEKPTAFSTMSCRANAADKKVTFSYLCEAKNSELVGVDVDAEFEMVKISFRVLNNGVSSVSLSDMVITDRDASARPIISSKSTVNLSIGTGKTESNAQTLQSKIEDAKKELKAAVMDPSAELVYPAFTVTQATYDALDTAIKNAEAALSRVQDPEEFREEESKLINAIEVYENAKLYGRGGDDAEGKEDQLIEVTADTGENGHLTEGHEKQLVRYGTSVTFIAIPDEGYEVATVYVNGTAYPGDDVVTIAKVTKSVHVTFVFLKKPRFEDVARGKWYYEAVESIAEMGLFSGTSATRFSPDLAMTRAMLVTVLHRLEGTPAVDTKASFADVEENKWYSDAIAWASASGIVNGYTADTFGTNDSISRQDAVTILYRYLQYKGITPAEGVSLDAYEDASKVSGYAKPAMEWAYATGLIKGTSDTTLSPKADCSRAQVAAILLRYTQNVSAK